MSKLMFNVALEELEVPYDWKKFDLTITHDGYTDGGIRVHVTREHEDNIYLLSNAIIIPSNFYNDVVMDVN